MLEFADAGQNCHRVVASGPPKGNIAGNQNVAYRGGWVLSNSVQAGQPALFLNKGWDRATPASLIS